MGLLKSWFATVKALSLKNNFFFKHVVLNRLTSSFFRSSKHFYLTNLNLMMFFSDFLQRDALKFHARANIYRPFQAQRFSANSPSYTTVNELRPSPLSPTVSFGRSSDNASRLLWCEVASSVPPNTPTSLKGMINFLARLLLSFISKQNRKWKKAKVNSKLTRLHKEHVMELVWFFAFLRLFFTSLHQQINKLIFRFYLKPYINFT